MAIIAACVFFLAPPQIVRPPSRPIIDLTQCGYEQARDAAQEARASRDSPTPRRSSATRAREAQRAEDAERQQDEARACEDRLHDAADLEAQWAAALSARNAASVALRQWQWSFVEFVALLATLAAAVWAATEARRAANATESGNRQDAEQSRRELRAYLQISTKEGSQMDLAAGKPVVVSFKIKNTGKTPALKVVSRSGAVIRDPGWVADASSYPPVEDTDPQFVIMPESQYTTTIDSTKTNAPWTPDDINIFKIRDGRQCIYFFGQIEYIDAISDKPVHYTRFQYEINVGALKARSLVVSPKGNDAT